MAAISAFATKENVISEKEELQLRKALGGAIENSPDLKVGYISNFELTKQPKALLKDRNPNRFSDYEPRDRWTELLIRLYINEEGKVDEVVILRARFSKIEAYVRDHLSKQNFEPGRKDDLPVKCYFEVPFNLNIDYYLRSQNQSVLTTPDAARPPS